MAKQKIIVGSILQLKIRNQFYCYTQILGHGGYCFFDYRSIDKLENLDFLLKMPVLFIVGVYKDILTQGRWIKVGKIAIREDLKVQPMQFIQDTLNPDRFEQYNPNTGEITPSTKEECKGLECAAVWEAEHVESRLEDYYNGVPNIWVEQLKIR
jgi:Immunity protein 26